MKSPKRWVYINECFNYIKQYKNSVTQQEIDNNTTFYHNWATCAREVINVCLGQSEDLGIEEKDFEEFVMQFLVTFPWYLNRIRTDLQNKRSFLLEVAKRNAEIIDSMAVNPKTGEWWRAEKQFLEVCINSEIPCEHLMAEFHSSILTNASGKALFFQAMKNILDKDDDDITKQQAFSDVREWFESRGEAAMETYNEIIKDPQVESLIESSFPSRRADSASGGLYGP